jgi:uncharacterized protein
MLNSLFEAIETRNLIKVQELIASGVDIEHIEPMSHSTTPLGCAVGLGYLEVVLTLLEAGANPNLGGYILPPLAIAIDDDYPEIVKVLIKAGADVNQLLDYRRTILMRAAHDGKREFVQMLVEAGANINACDAYGTSALEMAAFEGHQEIFDYLAPLTSSKLLKKAEKAFAEGIISRKAEEADEFINTVEEGNLESVMEAIADGVDINAIGESEYTALWSASWDGNVPIVRALIEAGANLDIRDEELGQTPVMVAVSRNQTLVVHLLVEAGANVNLPDRNGRTPLMEAAATGKVETVKVLLQAGAEINTQDNQNDSALSYAQKAGYSEIVEFLLHLR